MSALRLNKKNHLIGNIKYFFRVIENIFGRNGVEKICTCCGYKGRFITTGHPPRYGCLCPVCCSLERHRLLVLADRQENLFAGKEVLHFAPENILSQMISNCAGNILNELLNPAFFVKSGLKSWRQK